MYTYECYDSIVSSILLQKCYLPTLLLLIAYSELKVMCIHVHTMVKLMWCTAANPQPQTSGTHCPGPVTFTCVGTQISALFWQVNGSTVTTYVFEATHALHLDFPLWLQLPVPLLIHLLPLISPL